jgi:hypothetical protein
MTASFAEGVVWALAFWIKPFVAVPALLCWLLSAHLTWRTPRGRRETALDGAALLAGGLVAGAGGIAWLVGTGAWPAFVEIVFHWNQEYLVLDASGGEGWLYLAGVLFRFFPWILVHLLAVPMAITQIRQSAKNPAQALVAGLYLGWLIQGVCLQHLFDYVQAPSILLGITVVVAGAVAAPQPASRRLALAFFVICALVRFPALCVHRMSIWRDCVRHGSTPALRDRLTVLEKKNWSELERVKDYLCEQKVRDGELSCMHMGAISLYEELGVRPATRFHFVQIVVVFPERRDLIASELAACGQRFLVCDLQGCGMRKVQQALNEEELGSARHTHLRQLVFRSGRYLVFRLSGADTPLWLKTTFNQ